MGGTSPVGPVYDCTSDSDACVQFYPMGLPPGGGCLFAPGASCGADEQCASGGCACAFADTQNVARCKPVPSGGRCAKNDDCASGACGGFAPGLGCSGTCS